jgi:hypothetical protein
MLYRFPHGNLNISRQADVAAKRRESAENHVFRLTILEQFNFETLPPALDGETSFAYACGAGGGTRPPEHFNIFNVKML